MRVIFDIARILDQKSNIFFPTIETGGLAIALGLSVVRASLHVELFYSDKSLLFLDAIASQSEATVPKVHRSHTSTAVIGASERFQILTVEYLECP
jgi:hypothetical protein